MASTRNTWLLGIAVLLAVVRFIALPWVHAQAEARERLQVLTQRLDRSVGLQQNREAILGARKTFETATASARRRFPAPRTAEAFHLESQRRIGALVTASGLQLALFDWLLDGRIEDAGLAYARTRFQVEGPLRDVVRVHGELEGNLPFMAVREVQLNLVNAAPRLDDTRATMTIVADLYFSAEPRK
jgi:hypothetical protein